jgi:hypothetical protein
VGAAHAETAWKRVNGSTHIIAPADDGVVIDGIPNCRKWRVSVLSASATSLHQNSLGHSDTSANRKHAGSVIPTITPPSRVTWRQRRVGRDQGEDW